MNVAQICRQALLDADAVGVDGFTHRLFTQAELLSWAQDGHDKLLARLRQAHEDFGLVIRTSTDASFRWNGITYAPSSFALTTTARTYTLPPDVIEVRRIRATTSGQEGREFLHVDVSHPDFQTRTRSATTVTESGQLWWDVVGERTLLLAIPADSAMDIELTYIARPPKLQLYSTGTVTVTQSSATVAGVSTDWVKNELHTPADLIVGDATGFAPWIVGQTTGGVVVDPSALHSPISTIDSDTSLTLLGTYLGSTVATRGYMIASIPSAPEEHHRTLVHWVTAMILKKAKSAHADEQAQLVAGALADLTASTAERQTADPEFVEDYTT